MRLGKKEKTSCCDRRAFFFNGKAPNKNRHWYNFMRCFWRNVPRNNLTKPEKRKKFHSADKNGIGDPSALEGFVFIAEGFECVQNQVLNTYTKSAQKVDHSEWDWQKTSHCYSWAFFLKGKLILKTFLWNLFCNSSFFKVPKCFRHCMIYQQEPWKHTFEKGVFKVFLISQRVLKNPKGPSTLAQRCVGQISKGAFLFWKLQK